jgi:hypothetical protein
MSTPFLFLDHDGVMSIGWDFAISEDNRFGMTPFSVCCVRVLNDIISATDLEIVVSSDWKNHLTFDEIRDWYEENGVIKKPIGFTFNSPQYRGDNLEAGRAHEISTWVDHHRLSRWCAVDDLNMSGMLSGFVYCRNHRLGLMEDGVSDSIITALSVDRRSRTGFYPAEPNIG